MIVSEEEARSWLSSLPEWDAQAMARIEKLIDLLREENLRQNLVSRRSLVDVWRRHVVDSAQLLKYVPVGTAPWMDLGSGGGFPGLVIAALRPGCEILLVESRPRRSEWLERARTALELGRARIVASRLEVIETRDMGVISARAFAPLSRLLVLSSRFSTSETMWLLPKGRSAGQELQDLRGWRHAFHVEQSLTEPQAGIIVGRLFGRKGISP